MPSFRSDICQFHKFLWKDEIPLSLLGRHLVGHKVMAASQSQKPNLNRARLAMLATSCRRQQPLTFSKQADYSSCEYRPGLSLTSRREASHPCLVSPMRREEILRHCSPPSLRSVRHLSWSIQWTTGIFQNKILRYLRRLSFRVWSWTTRPSPTWSAQCKAQQDLTRFCFLLLSYLSLILTSLSCPAEDGRAVRGRELVAGGAQGADWPRRLDHHLHHQQHQGGPHVRLDSKCHQIVV